MVLQCYPYNPYLYRNYAIKASTNKSHTHSFVGHVQVLKILFVNGSKRNEERISYQVQYHPQFLVNKYNFICVRNNNIWCFRSSPFISLQLNFVPAYRFVLEKFKNENCSSINGKLMANRKTI